MRESGARLFGEPLRMKSEKAKEKDFFSLKVKENYMPDIDLSFINSQKALVMVEKNNVSEFIELVMESKNLSFHDIMSTEAEPKGIFYQVNYIAVYFVIAGAVAAAVIDVVRDAKDANVQKMKIRLADNEFTTLLIAASLEFGGLSFAQKVGKLYLTMVNDYFLENEGKDVVYAN
ncbi:MULTISPECIES: hypothetical protein [unclassified Enterococcus]|uniref:hypothetical protein n=1 Tax=unclassified Enterococcus TaxID=2608891 RepID=UPI0028FDBC4C|nr:MULTISPECIES: hypothetical protein [unclassified Enterococcus]MDU0320679.1 hypothetical protein [Enterococcus sp. 2STP]MDU0335832.1 hypothetical protein [Enterococcus sp. 2CBP]MDU0350385.1 hypothetical protein [Enterococcus sp. 3MOLP]